jgi:LacI family transcriptional regulator
MSKTRPTMHDVAALAGVSLKTVSRVVNDEPRVGEETTARVHQAIAALGYQRNDIAHHLRKGQSSHTLGLVIADVSNPFYAGIARGVEDVAHARGYMLITGSSSEDPEQEHSLVTALCRRRVDGLLIVPAARDHAYLRPEIAAGTQVVFLDRPPMHLDADAVLLDNRGGALHGVAYLLARGHRRIGVIAGLPEVYTGAERIAGYRQALAAAGIPIDPSLLRFEVHTTARAEEATRDLLRLPDPPTAIFATNNRLSVGVIRERHAHADGLDVVGFDDVELAGLLRVPIAVIRHDPVALGRRAAELLFARLDGDRSPPRVEIMPTELVVCGTGVSAPSNVTRAALRSV